MEKEFALYPEALALKELGFDEPCLGYYDGNHNLQYMFNGYPESFSKRMMGVSDSVWVGWISAPTYSQAFRWFREKYHIIGEVKFKGGKTTKTAWYDYVIYSEIDWNDENPSEQWKTYEEAELACLKKLIELVEQKIK